MSAASLAGATTVGSGSYADTLPSGLAGPQTTIQKTAAITGPVPTNDWWTSLLASTTAYRMFAYPLVYRCDNGSNSGLLIGDPTIAATADAVYASTFKEQLLVQGVYGGSTVVASSAVWADGYSDWTVTPIWKAQSDPTKYFKATFGHGLPFTYFEFADDVSPRISIAVDWDRGHLHLYDESASVTLGWGIPLANDYVTIEVNYDDEPSRKIYYGLFLPTGSTIQNIGGNQLQITFPAGKNYMSIGRMTGTADLATWKNYAYAFVTDTKVSWSVDAAQSKVQTTFAATTVAKQGGQTQTLLALFPHQHKMQVSPSNYLSQSFSTLRGTMKILPANSFTVTNDYRGILPFLPDRGSYDKAYLKTLLSSDKNASLSSTGSYWHGKELCRKSNLLPIANQLDEAGTRDALVSELKTNLVDWYTYTNGEQNKFFYYDPVWGSMIAYGAEYGLENFTDQHFHFGYFVTASALLGLYDADFVNRYGGMVDLVIRSYASPDRSDTKFPFLRTFDPYEGHSWADGRALSDDGNNQESSSESMQAWAGIYLWGLVTGNNTYRDLGIWGYTTEYAAIREYYQNGNNQYHANYTHKSIGILWSGKAEYGTWFTEVAANKPEEVYGIQLVPLTAPLLYLGHDTAYAQANYSGMVADNGGTENVWKDTFWKYQALFDAAAASAKFDESWAFDTANSKTFTCHWLGNCSALGTIDTGVYADTPSYAVFSKSGTRTYIAFNAGDTAAAVKFYLANGTQLGSMNVPPHAMVSTKDFVTLSTERLPRYTATQSGTDTSLAYQAGSWGVTAAVPAGAFSAGTPLSLLAATAPASDRSTLRVTPVAFRLEAGGSQPAQNITLTVTYADSDIAGYDEARLAVGRYDAATQTWVALPSSVAAGDNRIVARTDHLSSFAIIELSAAQNLAAVRAYPNPYRPGSGTAFDRAGGVVFSGLTVGTKLRLFTVAGELVFEGEETGGDGMFEWDAHNQSGQKVASGVYIYMVTAPSGEKKTGKIAVIR